jgi:glycine/D-amino acid oxidase-like deaminating enzyme
MRIAVIGTGIVGASAATALARRGHAVSLPGRPEGAAATGDAGASAFAEIIPPVIPRRAPFWLLDPDGPLSVPPAPPSRLAPWLLRKARAFLPGLRAEGVRSWMGFRPSPPDSLPAIGPAPGAPRVVLACGRGHLGLTRSPGMAEPVAEPIDERGPAIDLAPFRPARFAGACA